jgi:2-polyprenyl-6-hydroxyphenyl methylase/3-demethylubiquinone-9 3-methyltransferase
MNKTLPETYSQIDNNLYNTKGDTWWMADSLFSLMRTIMNPVRAGYAKRIIIDELRMNPRGRYALDIGCGGGALSEEVARMGFHAIGVDPSEQSLRAAAGHAKKTGLDIKYVKGSGEAPAFADGSFDAVFCCDVLEHVRDLPMVISGISRVLKPGGVFLYDTFNRTLISKITVIKILQEWKRWAIVPPRTHVWDMFIRPAELKTLLQRNRLDWKEHRGIKPSISAVKILGHLHERAMGRLPNRAFGDKFILVENGGTKIMYMGYAVKN